MSRVIASVAGAGTAYVTLDGHLANDFAPYVFVTTDVGRTWRALGRTLPADCVVKVIREHPNNVNLLFLGTERGLFASVDRGDHWFALRGNLPPVRVHDLLIHPRDNDLIVGTHGRGIYVLDDVTPSSSCRRR